VQASLQKINRSKLLLFFVHGDREDVVAVNFAVAEIVVHGSISLSVFVPRQAMTHALSQCILQRAQPIVGGQIRLAPRLLGQPRDGSRASFAGGPSLCRRRVEDVLESGFLLGVEGLARRLEARASEAQNLSKLTD
jgi:hypothetical protein